MRLHKGIPFLCTLLMLFGCSPSQIIAVALEGTGVVGRSLGKSEPKENGQPIFIEEHQVGNSMVRVFTQFIDRDFLKFDAYDKNNKKIKTLMRGNQDQVKKYLKEMNAEKKREYIRAQFLDDDIDLNIARSGNNLNDETDLFETHFYKGYKVNVFTGRFMKLLTYNYQLSDINGKIVDTYITGGKEKEGYKSMDEQAKTRFIQRIFRQYYKINLVTE